jgi:hypothetical protein
VGGSASNGVDYVRLTGQVTIPAGAHAAPIPVDVIDDTLVEGTETVVVTVLPPICNAIYPPPPDCYLVGQPASAVVSIRDNETLPNLPPRIALTAPSEGQVFVAPADLRLLAVGVDPDGWIGRVEFFEGTNKIGEDNIVFIQPPPPGQTQTFSFDWRRVPVGRYTLTARATDDRGATGVSAPVHITVRAPSELPVVTIHATDPIAREPDPRSASPVLDTATFLIRRTGDLSVPLTVYYQVTGTASNGADYVEIEQRVTIPAGDAAAPVLIRPLSDQLLEGAESVVLALEQLRCLADPPPPGCYLVGDPGRAQATILDRENVPPRVAITRPNDGQQFRAGSDLEINALALDPDGYVTLVEFFAESRKIGEQSMIFIVPPPPGQPQTFAMVWSNVTAGRYTLTARAIDNMGGTTRSAPVDILVTAQEPRPVVSITAPDPIAREGSSNTALFRVRRTGDKRDPLPVWYSIRGTASNGVDYAWIDGHVIIPAGRQSADIVITPLDDRLREGLETVILRLEPAPIAGPIDLYQIGRCAQAAALILDNDTLLPGTARLPDRSFHLLLPGPKGDTVRIEASNDLLNWEPMITTILEDGGVHFVDPDASGLNHRFYRALPDILRAEEE